MKKKNIVQITALLLSVILVLSACGAAASDDQRSSKMDYYDGVVMSEPAMEAPAAMAVPMVEEYGLTADNAVVSPTTQERVIIQTVDMGIVVSDPLEKMKQIAAMAERFGGFVVSRYSYTNTLQNGLVVPEATVTIRVPAEVLDEAMNEIVADVTEVSYENRNGQDVTDQYVDLKSRLTAKEAAEAKLFEIMDSAETAEETLLVFNQLQIVQSDIEVLKGQISYYEQSAAMSSITVGISADETIQPIEIGGWQFRGEVKNAVEALVRFGQNFVSFFIWFVIYLVPVLAVVILFIWVLWKLFGGMIKKLFDRQPKVVEEEKK